MTTPNIKELVERNKRIIAAHCEPDEEYIVHCLWSNITALESLQAQVTAPLPDEVERVLYYTNQPSLSGKHLKVTNDLIERLARNEMVLKESRDYWMAENKRLIDKCLEWLDGWNAQQDEIDTLQARVDELEKIEEVVDKFEHREDCPSYYTELGGECTCALYERRQIAKLTATLDRMNGTPCEQIRHQQELSTLQEQNKRLNDALKRLGDSLEEAMTGIEWYRNEHPESNSGADDEFMERANSALEYARANTEPDVIPADRGRGGERRMLSTRRRNSTPSPSKAIEQLRKSNNTEGEG